MSDEEAPPPLDSVPPESPHERGRDSRRRRLEGVIPEIVRRAVELGVEKAQEAPDNLKSFVGDLKLPKDIAHYLLQQIDETKNGLFRVVAKEIRDFLEHTNFAGEVQKLLTTVQFEVNTTIRFTPNDGRSKSTKSKSEDSESEDSDAGEAARSDEDDTGEPGERRLTPLPKPEVKTAVHVRRDERERRRRRDRDP
ncbi:MAG: hypothetical protein KF850_40360 [Labilithrix sp.]|nr:hypothetical protein [Labilithrix sp.]MBX3218329.1 hypothetical protein [Labilithrix sp.]